MTWSRPDRGRAVAGQARLRERSALSRHPRDPSGRATPARRPRWPSAGRQAALPAGFLLAGALLTAQAAAAPLPIPRPAAASAAPGGAVPLPVPRPEEAGPSLPREPARDAAGPVPPDRTGPEAFGPPLPARPADPLAPPEPDATCGPLLSSGKVVARMAAPIPGQDGCGIAAPVTLEAVISRTGRRIPLSPPAVMRCDFAERFADWLREDVAAAASDAGELIGIDDAAAYTCRHRNWQAGGRISEHARGNAVDVLAFRFARRTVGLAGPGDAATLAALRASACARFSTVLGPGSDAYHATDLHLDLQRRRNGFKLCQWTVPDRPSGLR